MAPKIETIAIHAARNAALAKSDRGSLPLRGYVRCSYATAYEKIEEALERLQ